MMSVKTDEQKGVVLNIADQNAFIDVDDSATLRWAQASRCHQ